MEKTDTGVIIIGAGISGLSCAKYLMNAGIHFIMLEADHKVGGRIKSDFVDGFILDHGFQVLQTAYPEARQQLNYDQLNLKPFSPGVAIRLKSGLVYISDPVRRPQDLWCTLMAPIGTIMDKLRVLALYAGNRIKGTDGIFESSDISTIDFLRAYGFSEGMIERFFRPFFAGACLDPQIRASSRVFRYLFDIFASGDAALPAKGMGAIPLQLAKGIPPDQIRFNAKVDSINKNGAILKTGEKIKGKTLVIATESPETGRLLKAPLAPDSKGEKCLYYSAKTPPISKPFLILNGQRKGLINNIAIPTLNAPTYSASGDSLIAVVVLAQQSMDDQSLKQAVQKELIQWFGDMVMECKHLKTYRIDHALPDQSPSLPNPNRGFIKVKDGIYVCGEYESVPGIQWALLSGRLTAEQIFKEYQNT
jgi:phytoene dehydrogenase-like protein